MAVTLDQDLGSNSNGAPNTSLTLTTIAAAAAGTWVVVTSNYWDNVGNATVTIGGVAATLDKRTTNGLDRFEIWSRYVAAGLASGSAIVATYANQGGHFLGAVSLAGLPSSGVLVTTSQATGSGTGWSSGAGTNTGFADAVYVGGSGSEDPTNPTTSTATSGTELHDRYQATDQQGFADGYKIVSTVASDSIAGNFSNANSTVNTGALAVYGNASAAPAETFQPRRMPLGV